VWITRPMALSWSCSRAALGGRSRPMARMCGSGKWARRHSGSGSVLLTRPGDAEPDAPPVAEGVAATVWPSRVLVVDGGGRQEGEEAKALVDFAVHGLKGDPFPELMGC
jgi:hypothetical protein